MSANWQPDLVVVMMVFIFLSSVLIYLLCFGMHYEMKKHLKAKRTSTAHYNQQKKLTIMLLGQVGLSFFILVLIQGALPMAAVCVVSGTAIPALLLFSSGSTPSNFIWDVITTIVGLYPMFSSLLTGVLTRPYYLFFKKLLHKIGNSLPLVTRKNSVTVIKF